MKANKVLNGLKELDSKYYCGSATLLNLAALLYIYKIYNRKLINNIITLADEDKDYFALSTKGNINKIEEKKIKRIKNHYIYVITNLKKIILLHPTNLLINNYKMLMDLLSYTLSSIKLDKEYKVISDAKKIIGEKNELH